MHNSKDHEKSIVPPPQDASSCRGDGAPPVAAAGPDQSITVTGTVVHLNGSQSYSPGGLTIAYQWSMLSKPVGSNATLTGSTTATPSFVADLHGTYSIQLIVTDSLAPGAFKNATLQNTLLNKLNAVIASIDAGNYADALGQLQNDILGKTDGCATSGAPDKNDWIVDCPDQNKVYTPLLNIIAEVKSVGEIGNELGIPNSTLSHHLEKLKNEEELSQLRKTLRL